MTDGDDRGAGRGDPDGQRWPSELETGLPESRHRATRWPGWIWAVPLAAVIFLLWLALRSWVFGAETITVTFDSAEGVSAGTPVRYKGLDVGAVESVELAPELDGVHAQVSIRGRMADHLRERTRFWVVRPKLGSGSLSDLISGAYIAMAPGEGKPKSRYAALDRPPVLPAEEPGRTFVLRDERASGLRHGSPVRLDGERVGRVLGVRYRKDARRADFRVFVREPYADMVRESTVFWRAERLSVSTAGTGLEVRLPSLSTLQEGAVLFHTPTAVAGGRAAEEAVFELHDSRAQALAEPKGPRLAYRVRLEDALEAFERGAEVALMGRRVGRVGAAEFEIDPGTGTLASTVTLALDARRFGLEPAADTTRGELRTALGERLDELVADGLRARVTGGPPVLGGRRVELVMQERAEPAAIDRRGDYPHLPTVPARPGIGEAVASLSHAAERLGEAPIAEIAADTRAIAERVRTLAESPELERSLQSLDNALADLEDVTASTNARADEVLANLDRAARAARSAAESMNRLTDSASSRGRGMDELMAELHRTARSIRELADYLNRHPEALIEGREGEP